MRVFVLDDDDETRELVGCALTRDGHRVTTASSFGEAIALLTASTFDVLVLDVMLNERSGLELCAKIRAQGIETPALFLSARGAVRARIEGFDAGGDDYLAKPFAIKELVARVRALGRRGPAFRPTTLVLGTVALDFARRQAQVSSQPIALTAREWEVLELLADARGRAVPFDTLLERAWGDVTEKSRASLAVIVSRLRQKLASAGRRPVVRTVQGVGYALECNHELP
jgi:DNA-binding response OmpR family regulator